MLPTKPCRSCQAAPVHRTSLPHLAGQLCLATSLLDCQILLLLDCQIWLSLLDCQILLLLLLDCQILLGYYYYQTVRYYVIIRLSDVSVTLIVNLCQQQGLWKSLVEDSWVLMCLCSKTWSWVVFCEDCHFCVCGNESELDLMSETWSWVVSFEKSVVQTWCWIWSSEYHKCDHGWLLVKGFSCEADIEFDRPCIRIMVWGCQPCVSEILYRLVAFATVWHCKHAE